MLSSELLLALCETDAEETKTCVRNHDGSLDRLMHFGDWFSGFERSCGKPKEGAVYLIVDALLDGLNPDLIYNRKCSEKGFESTMFGYLVEDAPAYFDLR